MVYKAIIVGTDCSELRKELARKQISIVPCWQAPPLENGAFQLEEEVLYVFAYKNPLPVLDLMAIHAGKPNFLTFCSRPGVGFVSTDERFKNIKLLSPEKLVPRVVETIEELVLNKAA